MIKSLYAAIIISLSFLTYSIYSQDLKVTEAKQQKEKILIYSKELCSFCIKAKKILDERNIPYTDINVTSNRQQMVELYNKTGQSTVPYIFINGKFIGGYQELLELETAKNLDKLLE